MRSLNTRKPVSTPCVTGPPAWAGYGVHGVRVATKMKSPPQKRQISLFTQCGAAESPEMPEPTMAIFME